MAFLFLFFMYYVPLIEMLSHMVSTCSIVSINKLTLVDNIFVLVILESKFLFYSKAVSFSLRIIYYQLSQVRFYKFHIHICEYISYNYVCSLFVPNFQMVACSNRHLFTYVRL